VIEASLKGTTTKFKTSLGKSYKQCQGKRVLARDGSPANEGRERIVREQVMRLHGHIGKYAIEGAINFEDGKWSNVATRMIIR